MSGSSVEEIGDDDGLQIKPPQPHHRRNREDRLQQRRWVGEPDRQRGFEGGSGSRGASGEPRRRDYYDQRPDRGHASTSRNQRQPDPDASRQRRGGDELRHRSRRFDEYGNSTNPNPKRMEVEAPSASRGHIVKNRRAEPDPHRRGDHRSKQLHKSVKQKRKHLELEEQKALREIEKRNRRERRDDQERTSGTEKRRRKHEAAPQSPPHSRQTSDHEDEEGQVHVDEARTSEELDDILVVEEIIKSSPEYEEETESRSQFEEHPYHSDVSSDAEVEEEPKEGEEKDVTKPNKSPSQTSSKSANSDSSSGSDSDGSSGSKSSCEADGNNKKRKSSPSAKNGKKSPSDAVGDKERPDVIGSDVEIMDVEKKVEKPPLDESLLTDVDRAIREVNLLPPYFPAVQGCRRVEEFSLLNRIEEGTYGVVYRAKDRRTNEVVALKRLKMEKEKDGFPITSLREINTLLKAQHENIVTVREIVVGSNTDKIFLVMDYVEHDLKALMETLKQKSQMFLVQEVKCLMIQLLRAVAHLHDNWILHRDLKTSNLLLSHKGILKVGDFGLAREYGSPLKGYTPIVVTLWYRAPELLLGIKEYSTPIDVWSVGCIFGELVKMEPTFPGKSEANQLNLIFQTLGTPNDRIWPGYTKLPLLQKMTFVDQPMNKLKTKFGGAIGDKGIDLMNKLLTYNPAKRISAEEALNHSFFKESPLPIDPSVFPTWPAKSELGHRKAPSSPKPPSGGRQFKDLRDDDDSSGFFLGTGAGDRRLPMGGGFSLKF